MIRDLLGEDEVMEALRKRLLERSVPEDRVSSQIKRLRFQFEAYRMEQEGCLTARGRRIQETPTEVVPGACRLGGPGVISRGDQNVL